MKKVLCLCLLLALAVPASANILWNNSYEYSSGDVLGWGAYASGWYGDQGGFGWNVVYQGGPWNAPQPVDGNALVVCKSGGPSYQIWHWSPEVPAGVYQVSWWEWRYSTYDSGYPMTITLQSGLIAQTHEVYASTGWTRQSASIMSSGGRIGWGLSGGNDDMYAMDYVTVDPVPEPPGFLALLAGIPVLLRRRR